MKFKCLIIGTELTVDGLQYERDAQQRLAAHTANWTHEQLTNQQRDTLGWSIERRRPTLQRMK